MTYKNECKPLLIKVSDFILTKGKELLQVKKILSNGVLVKDGREISCGEIIDVKKWEEEDNG